jgi:hypothetical protein
VVGRGSCLKCYSGCRLANNFDGANQRKEQHSVFIQAAALPTLNKQTGGFGPRRSCGESERHLQAAY